MTLRDDLIAAKALIDTPSRWFKGNYVSVAGCMCALGACRQQMYGSPFGGMGDTNPLAQALANALPSGRWSVSDYNDDPETTHADIMALFDRAIAAATENTGEAAK